MPKLDLDEFIENVYCADSNAGKMPGFLKYMNSQMFKYFNPDINGYTLVFLVPPPFSCTKNKSDSFITYVKQFVVFAGVDFTPPTRSIESEKANARVGGVPYATEVIPSEQCTVSYIDNHDLDIYNFHLSWSHYIHELLEGFIEPSDSYLDPNGEHYGAIDYAGSLFTVKFDPDMRTIKYVGKTTGVFPQQLPSKELLGSRSSNELTTLPFTYSCAMYDETMNSAHPIWRELENHVLSAYDTSPVADIAAKDKPIQTAKNNQEPARWPERNQLYGKNGTDTQTTNTESLAERDSRLKRQAKMQLYKDAVARGSASGGNQTYV